MFKKCLIGILGSILLLGLGTAQATVINASNSGSDLEGGLHLSGNYIVGRFDDVPEARNWFVFDLSGLGTITNATLSAYLLNKSGAFETNGEYETWTLWDVSTSIEDLTGGTGGIDAFNDLGSGTSFGSVNITPDDMGLFVNVSLNSAALASINSSNGLWAIGGSITTLDGLAFGYSGEDPRVHLTVNAVPLPAALPLMASVVGMLGFGLRRSKVIPV